MGGSNAKAPKWGDSLEKTGRDDEAIDVDSDASSIFSEDGDEEVVVELKEETKPETPSPPKPKSATPPSKPTSPPRPPPTPISSPPPSPPKKKPSLFKIRKNTNARSTDIHAIITDDGTPEHDFNAALTGYLTFGAPGRFGELEKVLGIEGKIFARVIRWLR